MICFLNGNLVCGIMVLVLKPLTLLSDDYCGLRLMYGIRMAAYALTYFISL